MGWQNHFTIMIHDLLASSPYAKQAALLRLLLPTCAATHSPAGIGSMQDRTTCLQGALPRGCTLRDCSKSTDNRYTPNKERHSTDITLREQARKHNAKMMMHTMQAPIFRRCYYLEFYERIGSHENKSAYTYVDSGVHLWNFNLKKISAHTVHTIEDVWLNSSLHRDRKSLTLKSITSECLQDYIITAC